jgi:hypothetical protein
MQIGTAANLSTLDPFDHFFVDAVLHLRGIDTEPTLDQLREACAVLDAFYRAVMKAPESEHPVDIEWLEGHSMDSAAAQFAFLYTQFGLIYLSQADVRQVDAWKFWWRTGEVPDWLRAPLRRESIA